MTQKIIQEIRSWLKEQLMLRGCLDTWIFNHMRTGSLEEANLSDPKVDCSFSHTIQN